TWQLGYFHECMSGFEHQVAAHMMAEGMVDESLILTKKIHERYHPSKRNPFNEIECSDHYARAMASYGTFINACGFTFHGPKKRIGFNPKINPQDFKAAFTASEGWGSFSQKKSSDKLNATIKLEKGQLELTEISLYAMGKSELPVDKVLVALNGKKSDIKQVLIEEGIAKITLNDLVVLEKGDELIIQLG